ncbi:hypothetical protein [Microbacterium hydrocarbonoxydans]|uniref:hypothetical protein n=1 Tax=Microbacterium hydrocarbonoxydans TaxID=273678 RepID=UPI0011153829|nr:hypothetical protein [Microbacterium hydrocarbonoxydans]
MRERRAPSRDLLVGLLRLEPVDQVRHHRIVVHVIPLPSWSRTADRPPFTFTTNGRGRMRQQGGKIFAGAQS